MISRVPRIVWAALLPVLLGLPFVGRAYFVDDNYHMLMARGLLEHPLRPYDFRADDDGAGNLGWERGRPPRMVNPPGHHFLLALFWKLGGGRLWFVRVAFLLLAGLAAALIHRLAQWCLIPPGPATLLCALTPVFWLSSYSLLIDSSLLVFFLGALWAWVEGLRRPSAGLLALSGLFMGLTLLIKYTGGFVAVLALVWWAMEPPERRRWGALWTFLIPVAVFAAWAAWTAAVYGEPHVIAASRRVVEHFRFTHLVVFLTFFTGVFLFPAAAWPWLWRDRRGLCASAAAAAAAFAVFLAGPLGGFSPAQGALLAFCSVGAVLFLVAVLGRARAFRVPSDAFLVVWLLLGAAQMAFIMGWVAARYYLTILPPAVFLLCRAVQDRYAGSPSARRRFEAGLAAVLFVAGAALARADHLQAETGRRIVADTARDGCLASGRRCFYLGDSFTSSYLKAAGWSPAFPDTPLAPGDLILRQEVIMPAWWFRAAPGLGLRPVKAYAYASRYPLRVMDNRGAAGFYASAWGALPFTFSRGPLERYTLLEVTPPTEDGR